MNIPSTHQRVNASDLPLETLAANHQISDSDKVAEVSRQFEAVLVRQIMQDIRKPVLASQEGDPTTSGIYNDMINNQLADNITRSGGVGLAKSLAAELGHQILQPSSTPAPTQTKAAAVRKPARHPF